MARREDALMAEALSLPALKRARLANELIASLDKAERRDDGGVSLLREVNRRADEVEAGTAELISASTAKRRISAALRAARTRSR